MVQTRTPGHREAKGQPKLSSGRAEAVSCGVLWQAFLLTAPETRALPYPFPWHHPTLLAVLGS